MKEARIFQQRTVHSDTSLEDQELHSGLLTSWVFQGSSSSPKDLELLRALLGSRVSSQALANPHLYSCVVILTVLPSLLWTHRGSLGERWKARTGCLQSIQRNMEAAGEDRVWLRA